ncbi:MAG: N-acetyltransferase [Pseudomonadota bacterium]
MIIDRTKFAPATQSNMSAIIGVHTRAFGRTTEAELARQLIEGHEETLDLCAMIDDAVVGHCLLTELKGPSRSMALAPLAVDPNWRDFQIGTELVRQILSNARSAGWKSVFVLGDPDYYGRFGFKNTTANHVKSPYEGAAIQALELTPGALSGYKGSVTYPQAFDLVAAA